MRLLKTEIKLREITVQVLLGAMLVSAAHALLLRRAEPQDTKSEQLQKQQKLQSFYPDLKKLRERKAK
jgi:hypothetical protein